jgi:hypothetical protein
MAAAFPLSPGIPITPDTPRRVLEWQIELLEQWIPLLGLSSNGQETSTTTGGQETLATSGRTIVCSFRRVFRLTGKAPGELREQEDGLAGTGQSSSPHHPRRPPLAARRGPGGLPQQPGNVRRGGLDAPL